mgnify:FL=1
MPVHKFITIAERSNTRTQPDSVHWMPKEATYNPLRQNGGLRWEIFAQNKITILPKNAFTVILGFGVKMTDGICLISLKQELKQRRCSLQDGVVSEDTDDIIITIQNNSDSEVKINESESLCLINYYV